MFHVTYDKKCDTHMHGSGWRRWLMTKIQCTRVMGTSYRCTPKDSNQRTRVMHIIYSHKSVKSQLKISTQVTPTSDQWPVIKLAKSQLDSLKLGSYIWMGILFDNASSTPLINDGHLRFDDDGLSKWWLGHPMSPKQIFHSFVDNPPPGIWSAMVIE